MSELRPPTVLPFGSWPSPISAEELARAGRRLEHPSFVGDEVWWGESRPDEGGRAVVVASAADGTVRDVLPEGWSARTRVHEYGGRSFVAAPGDGRGATGGASLVFCSYDDQRLFLLAPSAVAPVPLTPVPDEPAGLRYADLVLDAEAHQVLTVQETHASGAITRSVVAVPLDGRAATDPTAVAVLATGHDFFANPRVSPDRGYLAWLQWDHPRMPWDGTELVVVALDADGRPAGEPRVVLGGPDESVVQAEWLADDRLLAVSDRSGWWNLHEVHVDGLAGPTGRQPRHLAPVEAELGMPLWLLGGRTVVRVDDGGPVARRLALIAGVAPQRLCTLDLDDPAARLVEVPQPWTVWTATPDGRGDEVVGVAQTTSDPYAVVRVDVRTGASQVLRSASAVELDPAYLPEPTHEVVAGVGGREVHGNVYPPRNPLAEAPAGERPPYVVLAHGGPTSYSPMRLEPTIAYLTSRGIGVVDVNYGGSTGHGREYRRRLQGTWGVVDVEDCVAFAEALAADGRADRDRLAIMGGSAGGWTVLSALTTTDTFACGISWYGVADLDQFAATTHDFESRYLHQLVGDPAADPDLYRRRSPLTHADRITVPTLLVQGSEDLVVPPAQSEVIRDVLVAKDLPHAYVLLEGEAHGFRRADSIIRAYEATLSFLGQVLGFEPPDVPHLPLDGVPVSTRRPR